MVSLSVLALAGSVAVTPSPHRGHFLTVSDKILLPVAGHANTTLAATEDWQNVSAASSLFEQNGKDCSKGGETMRNGLVFKTEYTCRCDPETSKCYWCWTSRAAIVRDSKSSDSSDLDHSSVVNWGANDGTKWCYRDATGEEHTVSCFDKARTSSCLVQGEGTAEEAYAACYGESGGSVAERVLMADLRVGDEVLTADVDGNLAITQIVANQHVKSSLSSPMLTLHLSTGATVSMTPDHALYIDGELKAAENAKVGSTLSRGTVERISVSTATVINPVTAMGTLLASDTGEPVLAASHPIWAARAVLSSSAVRRLTNLVLFLAGDVDCVASGAVVVLSRLCLTMVAMVTLGSVALARTRRATRSSY